MSACLDESSPIEKDPDAVLDYAVDWAGKSWLAPGETISESIWLVPDGLTKVSESLNPANTIATVWLSGGVADTTYVVTNRITTSAGRTDDRSRQIVVVER